MEIRTVWHRAGFVALALLLAFPVVLGAAPQEPSRSAPEVVQADKQTC